MPIAVLMPALSPTMTSGILSNWIIKEGTIVHAGDAIAEIETDKTTMELEAVSDGILAKILIDAGSIDVAVNTPIAVIIEENEDQSLLEDFIANLSSQNNVVIPKSNKRVINTTAISNTYNNPHNERVSASPLARRIAVKKNINLKDIIGTGPYGRIIRHDVENVNSVQPICTLSEITDDPSYKRTKLSSMRRTLIKRLSESKKTIPHFYLSVECNIDALLRLRTEMNNNTDKAEQISINDLVIKASAMALMRQPKANACFDNDSIKYFDHADIAIAISTDDGLVAPLLRRADLMSISQIAAKTKDIINRARSKKILPIEHQGGSFSISNLGMYGVDQFQAVINPPHACILAVGRGRKMPIVDNKDSIVIATQMHTTLSIDHRVVDGALAASLLSEIKLLLENPVKMLI